MVLNDASGCGAGNCVMPGNVPGHAADRGTLDASLGAADERREGKRYRNERDDEVFVHDVPCRFVVNREALRRSALSRCRAHRSAAYFSRQSGRT